MKKANWDPPTIELEREVKRLTEDQDDISFSELLAGLPLQGHGATTRISQCLTQLGFVKTRIRHRATGRWRRMTG